MKLKTFTIRTRYRGPSNNAGARITTNALGRTLTVPFDYAADDAHRVAAEAMASHIVGDTWTTITRAGEYGETGYYWEVS